MRSLNENYFIVLGLSFDPIETNEDVIQQAIKQKNEQWQKEAKNPRKQVIAKEKISHISDMKKVLLDPQLRIQEAKQAVQAKNIFKRDLENELIIIQTKGYITPIEVKEILKKYDKYGFSENEIKDMLSTNIEALPVTEIEDNAPIIDQKTGSQLKTYFENLGVDDYSLYSYLGIDKTDDGILVVNKAKEKLKMLLDKGSKSNTDEAEQKLLGLCVTIFSNEQIKNAYDNYLSGCQYKKIDDLINTGIKTNGTMNQNLFNALTGICIKDYALSEKYATIYIINNIKINKYSVDIEKIREFAKQLNNSKQQTERKLSKSDEKEILREKIIQEEQIREQIEKEKAEKQRIIDEQKAKEQEEFDKYNNIKNGFIENIDKQTTFINDKITFMEQHTEKRAKYGLLPSKVVAFSLIGLFIVSIILSIYVIYNPGYFKIEKMYYLILGDVGISLICAVIYNGLYFLWDKMKKNQESSYNVKNEYLNYKQEANIVAKKYKIFTQEAKDELVSKEKEGTVIVNNFIKKYNDYIKYNNMLKIKPWMSKSVFVPIICHMLLFLTTVINLTKFF